MVAQPPFVTIGSRVAKDEGVGVRKDAKRLGLTKSQWLRIAAIRFLAAPISKEEAAAYLEKPQASANGRRPT